MGSRFNPSLEDRVVRVLQDYTTEPIGAFDVLQLIEQKPGEPEIALNTIRTTLSHLYGEGCVIRPEKGKYAIGDLYSKGKRKKPKKVKPKEEVLSTEQLLEEFKEMSEAIFDKLKLFNDMEKALKFWVSEAKNMGVRYGVLKNGL